MGCVSTPSTLIQVSNVESPNVNGKSQLSQPEVGGSLVADQTARNPVRVYVLYALDTNVTLSEFVLEMMVHG